MNLVEVDAALRKLRLSGMADVLDARLRHAQAERGRRSRGELVARWLQGTLDAEALCAAIDPAAYAGFNLVVGDLRTRTWAWVGNRDPANPHVPQTPQLHRSPIGAGVHTVSNASLDTPWPKTTRLTHAMRMAVEQSPFDAERTLTQALASTQACAATEMPNTGVPAATEKALSSPFVHLPERHYGTRSSLLMRVDHLPGAAPETWRVQMDEWTHRPPEVPGRPHAWAAQQRVSETLAWVRPGA